MGDPPDFFKMTPDIISHIYDGHFNTNLVKFHHVLLALDPKNPKYQIFALDHYRFAILKNH
jgi:hypothetical protein